MEGWKGGRAEGCGRILGPPPVDPQLIWLCHICFRCDGRTMTTEETRETARTKENYLKIKICSAHARIYVHIRRERKSTKNLSKICQRKFGNYDTQRKRTEHVTFASNFERRTGSTKQLCNARAKTRGEDRTTPF